MMRIIRRHIVKTVALYTFLAMVLLIGIFMFFTFLEESEDIGRANYHFETALIYVFLKIPYIIYNTASLMILLGVVLGLGVLVANRELSVIQSAGVPTFEIGKIATWVGVGFIFLTMVGGELWVPKTLNYANNFRDRALGKPPVLQLESGLWLKNGEHFIHIGGQTKDDKIRDVVVVRLSDDGELKTLIKSDNAHFEDNYLAFETADAYDISRRKNRLTLDRQTMQNYRSDAILNPELIQSLRKDPKIMTTAELFRHIGWLEKNELAREIYEIEFYQRIIKPLTLLSAILIALPFIFGRLGARTIGYKIFFALVVALFFEFSAKISTTLSLQLNFDPLIGAALPTLAVFFLAIFLLLGKNR